MVAIIFAYRSYLSKEIEFKFAGFLYTACDVVKIFQTIDFALFQASQHFHSRSMLLTDLRSLYTVTACRP